MYRDLGFIRVAGRHARRELDRDRGPRPAYAYPVTRTSRSWPSSRRVDSSCPSTASSSPTWNGTGGRHRLPASDDLLAKWMALTPTRTA